jgi:hypothetical protein
LGKNRFAKRCVASFGCDGSRRGTIHPKDVKIYEGDVWIPYKRIRVHNQGRKKINKT